MSHWRDDPAEVARAKELASGELGRQVVHFPTRFAQPVLLSDPPAKDLPVEQNNATATMICLEGRHFAITCDHVLAAYEKRLASNADLVFQIAEMELKPLEQLVDRDARLDIAILDVSGLRHRNTSVRGGDIEFHQPPEWPPRPVTEADFVSLSGYPGVWRQAPVDAHVDFDTFAIGSTPITRSAPERLVCQFERENWISSYGSVRGLDLTALGGMSGGPVMVMRTLHFEMAGIITDFSPMYDLLYATPLANVGTDGRVICNPL